MESRIAALEATWGTGSSIAHWCPSVADDPRIRAQFGQYERRSASPGSASAYLRLLASIDVRGVLPLVASPTLVIHQRATSAIPIEVGRYIADNIPGAVMCELDTEDHLIWFSEKVDEITEQVERFVTSRWSVAPPDRSLTTVVAVLVDGDGRAVLDRWRSARPASRWATDRRSLGRPLRPTGRRGRVRRRTRRAAVVARFGASCRRACRPGRLHRDSELPLRGRGGVTGRGHGTSRRGAPLVDGP